MASEFYVLNLAVSEILFCLSSILYFVWLKHPTTVITYIMVFSYGFPMLYLCGALPGSGPPCSLPEVQTSEIQGGGLWCCLADGARVLSVLYVWE